MDLGREFVPRPRYFLLLRQKKVSKEKATRDTRPAGSLRFSKVAAAAELASLKQSSPTPPRLPAMLGAPHGSPFVVAPATAPLLAVYLVGSLLPTLPKLAKRR